MQKKIDLATLEKVAENSRITLSEDEKKKILPQLQEVLNAFSKLDELDTKNSKPSFQPIELENVFREDNPKQGLSTEESLSLTMHRKGQYFKGPKVI